jgi:hypothetical protein
MTKVLPYRFKCKLVTILVQCSFPHHSNMMKAFITKYKPNLS